MIDLTKQGYDIHSKNYDKRIWLQQNWLYPIDELVGKYFNDILVDKEQITIIDAACGTGERLKTLLFKNDILPTQYVAYGYDFSAESLIIAKSKKYFNRRLYDLLVLGDLREFKFKEGITADILLCLWDSMSNIINEHDNILKLFKSQLSNNGHMIFDVHHINVINYLKKHGFTDKIIREYGLPNVNKNEGWWQRPDGTLSHVVGFESSELYNLLKINGLNIEHLFGLDKEESKLFEYDLKTFKLNGKNEEGITDIVSVVRKYE